MRQPPVQETRLPRAPVLLLALSLSGCAQLASLYAADRGQDGAVPAAAPAPRSAQPVAPAPRPVDTTGWASYEVRPGDTLGAIASCRRASVEDVARANGLADPDRVLAGARLRVPARDRCAARPAASQAASPVQLELETASPAPEVALAIEPEAPARAREERARTLLAAARRAYDAARFEEALSGAEAAAGALPPAGAGSPEATDLRARSYLLAGMAAAGLEQRERATAFFGAAFALQPGLELAPEDTSPRILELVEEAVPGAGRARR